jgi:hypothetical protein
MTKYHKIQSQLTATEREMTQIWNCIPDGMRRKLNARELAQYAERHVLPSVRKAALLKYELTAETKHRLEVYA